MKIQKKKIGGGVRSGGSGGSGWGGQGGCERRIEVFVKIKKKKIFFFFFWGGGLGKFTKGREGGVGGGMGGSGWWGFRVDVNAMLGVDVGYGGCEPRIEGKKVLYNIKKIKKMWGGRGRGNI